LEYQCGRKFLIEKIATTKQLSQLSCDQYVWGNDSVPEGGSIFRGTLLI
jgi:hypothetical protein